jgi:uncharacterized protein (TIGR02598 family)
MNSVVKWKGAHRSRGFSLIEVAISLGIMGFACAALVGLVPIGLTSFHQAMGNTIESEIVQNLTNDMLLANFSDLYQYSYANSTASANQTYYYDSDGTLLTVTTTGVVPTGTVYTVVVTLSPLTSTASSSNSPAGLTVSTANSGISTAAPTDTTWAGAFSGLTSAYNVSITIANSPSTATYTPTTTYPSIAAYLWAYATNAGGEQSLTTHPPDQFCFVIANNNR